jgi:outer membrane protein assembly factor BamA
MVLKTPRQLFFVLNISFFFILSLLFSTEIFSQSLEINVVKFIHKDKKSTFADNILNDAVGITKEKLYKPSVLGEDVLKLSKFYFDNGFFDVKVDTSVIYNYLDTVENDVNVDINFLITENKRYRIDSLEYKGLGDISGDLKKLVDSIKTIKKKDFYNKVFIIQQTNEIVDLLQNNGYMNAGIKKDSGTTVIKYDSAVTVIINFESADALDKFGKTIIRIDKNVYNVDENIFTKVLTYKEGDIYSKREKIATEKNMTEYGIVQSARLEPVSESKTDDVDFQANILLNKKNEITPYVEAANLDNTFYVGGGAKYVNKYFLNGGKVLTVELQSFLHSSQVNRFVFATGITQPFLFNNNSSLTDKVTVGLYNLQGFKNYYIGNLTRLDYFISEHTFYNNASLDFTTEMVWFKFDVDSSGTLTQFNTFLNATIIHDNTNSKTAPSQGFFHLFSAGEGGIIPSLVIKLFNKNVTYSKFYKLYTSNRFYLDLGKIMETMIFATSFKIGDIVEYGHGDKQLPVQPLYRFFSGGTGSLRGWSAKSNGVLVNRLNGGEFLLEGSLEMRKKLFPASATFTKNIGLAVFLDYGNVWETHKDFRFNQIALAVGFGPRYDLFLGPIRVDLGFKLYDPTDLRGEKWLFSNMSRIFKDKYAITVGIGEAF